MGHDVSVLQKGILNFLKKNPINLLSTILDFSLNQPSMGSLGSREKRGLSNFPVSFKGK